MWSIIHFQVTCERLWPWNKFCYVQIVTLTLTIWPWVSHDTINYCVERSNMTIMSYGSDTNFRHVCNVTLTLEVWPCCKVMTCPWVMDNSCVKYYQDPTWLYRVMAHTRILGMCALWPWSWPYDLGSRSFIAVVKINQCSVVPAKAKCDRQTEGWPTK